MGTGKILVSDFDGTITRRDFFDRVRQRWPRPAENDPWEKYLAGGITHFDALTEIFRGIRTTEADLLEPALLVSPMRRFARGWLADALRERGEAFHPFERWSQIVPHLLPC